MDGILGLLEIFCAGVLNMAPWKVLKASMVLLIMYLLLTRVISLIYLTELVTMDLARRAPCVILGFGMSSFLAGHFKPLEESIYRKTLGNKRKKRGKVCV